MVDSYSESFSDEKSSGKNSFIRVTNINIMLNTNISGMKPTPLTFDMLYHADLEKGRYPTAQYSLPYFTDSVKYPMDYLSSKTYSERVDLFFNKKRFNTMCRQLGTDYINYEDEEDSNDEAYQNDGKNDGKNDGNSEVNILSDNDDVPVLNTSDTKVRRSTRIKNIANALNKWTNYKKPTPASTNNGGKPPNKKSPATQEKENADHNVRCMLIILLPIADEFINVFQSSYDQYILNKPSPELYTLRNIDPTMLLNPSWLPFYNYYSARKYSAPIQEISYIQQGGTKYAVSNVVWLNDLVNHPVYREFLTNFHEKNLEKKHNRPKIKAKLKERKAMFQSLLKRNIPTNDTDKDIFTRLFETLLQNVNIATGKKQPTDKQIAVLIEKVNTNGAEASDISKTVSAVTNPKDAAKRDSVIKMATYFSKIIPLATKSKEESKDQSITDSNLSTIVNNIVNAYIEYSLYNESADKGMQINLKDDARIFTEFYNQALFIKAVQLIDDFVHNRIARFDMNEKNLDGTPKSKLELDIIRTIRTNFPYYIKLNEDMVKPLRNVVEPLRRSSNPELQQLLKNMFNPVDKSNAADDSYAFMEIYNKYIANTRKHIASRFTENFMYTGVSTVIESASSPEPTKPSGGDDSTPSSKEIPEIYVYVNVIQKEEYEKDDARSCIMTDDNLANNLKRVLFTNTMMDDSFPEVNPYRAFKLLKGSENKTPFNAAANTPANTGDANVIKSNPETPTQINATGGKRGSFQNARIRHTHKYEKPYLRSSLLLRSKRSRKTTRKYRR